MFDAGRRMGRIFLLVAILGMAAAKAQVPATTIVQDTVYRADGGTAEGTLSISWPPFTTASGQAVAEGTVNVTLGTNGALVAQLVPNSSSTPANTVYTVVYQLSDGTNKTEYWVVPTTSPATLAQVRTTLGTMSAASQLATQQYVAAAVAAKANDNAVVHLSGTETITGLKQFSASPSFPTPVQPSDAANKTYVDTAVENSGAGSFVSKTGDGATTRFYLSQTPFVKKSTTVFDEEYASAPLDPARWMVSDPGGAISVSGGQLQVAGGTGADGVTTLVFAERVELGGAVVLQHGDVQFNGASSGVIGGLYAEGVSAAGCLAGFQITPNGSGANIQALISGLVKGPVLSTVTGHHYVMTTRMYCAEIYRMEQVFHSSVHPAGDGYGGAAVAADVRVVLAVQDIDPNNPATQVELAMVLYDGIIANAPGFCTYAPVNAFRMECSLAFTQLIQAVDAEVRTALPGESYVTEMVGTLSAGAQCQVTSSGELEFYSAYVPAANQLIEVHYRGSGRAIAQVSNAASRLAQQRGPGNGMRSEMRQVKLPPARTSVDCENAALAVLDDAAGAAWSGKYEAWSDFLPGNAQDIWPGDALNVTVASQEAALTAVVRQVRVAVRDLAGEHSVYSLEFANDAAKPLAMEFESTKPELPVIPLSQAVEQVGNTYLTALTAAAVTQVTSATINVDTGAAAPAGGGIEVRWSDEGWGMGNDRNLVGRFAVEAFSLPRLTRVQTYFMQQYDSEQPPRYSRYSAVLHVDYPL